VNREPLLYLEFNKHNKQNVYKINLFEKFNFSQSQSNIVDALIDVRNETSKPLLKISKNKKKHNLALRC